MDGDERDDETEAAAPDFSELDLEDWEAVEAAIAELAALEPSDRSRRFDEWRRNSASGQFLTAVALGFHEVFGPPRRENTEIVEEAPGEPEDETMSLRLDKENPTDSVMVIKAGHLPPPPNTVT